MAMMRQVQLRRGSTYIDLNVSPYDVVAGSWASGGANLELRVLVQATTLPELMRYVAPIRRMLNQGAHYAGEQMGSAVYVYTKTCDDVYATAEHGATWQRKQIISGSVVEPDASEFAAGRYALTLTLSLEVSAVWERATPENVLARSGTVTTQSNGSVLVTSGSYLTARRKTWSLSTGVTVRVRWLWQDYDTTFFFAETGTYDMRATYLAADNKLYIYDAANRVASSSALAPSALEELDIVFKWDIVTPKMTIWVNGVENGSVAGCTLADVDTYKIFQPTGYSAYLYSWQLWPTQLTDAQCAGFYAWGRPEPELAYYIPPTDTKNTNAAYKIYNVPGEADARLRLLLSDATQAYDSFRVGLRPLRIPTATKWECESGTLGAQTADAADATASAGHKARFTPASTSYGTQVTISIADYPADVAAYYGQYRLLLAGIDNAASVGLNILKWRLVCAGTGEAYSGEFSFAVVAQYSLLDLGTLRIPAGSWPEEAESCATTVQYEPYLSLEIQIKNTANSGTLDFDAIYLQPVELEGVVNCTALTTAEFLALDFASTPASWMGVSSALSLEPAHFADYLGDDLALAPVAGDAGLLMVYAYRDTNEKAYPNDAVTVYPYIRPGWL